MVLFLFHYNSYDVKTGTLDHLAFDEYVEENKSGTYPYGTEITITAKESGSSLIFSGFGTLTLNYGTQVCLLNSQ